MEFLDSITLKLYVAGTSNDRFSRLIINVRASVFDMQLIKISSRAKEASGLKRNAIDAFYLSC